MSILSGVAKCPNIQQNLQDVFMGMSPNDVREPENFFKFLISDVNRQGIQQTGNMVSPGDGLKKTLEVRYESRLAESTVNESFDLACDSIQEFGDTTTTYEIDESTDGLSIDFALDFDNLREKCANNNQWYSSRLMMAMNAMARKLATQMANQAVSLTGQFTDGSTTKNVQTQDSSGNNLRNMYEEIIHHAKDNAYPGIPYVFGYNEATKYFARLNAGCCMDDGVDLEQLTAGNNMVYGDDYRIKDAFGTDQVLMVAPGALQAIFYRQFVGQDPNTAEDDSHVQGEIVDPIRGIPYDLYVSKNCTNKGTKVNTTIRLAAKLVGMPSDMFVSGDRMEGNTFVHQFNINNP